MASQVWTKSDPAIEVGGVRYILNGPLDILADLDSGRPFFYDNKTADPDKRPPSMYKLQQNAYALNLILDNKPVSQYGLLYFNPDSYVICKSSTPRHGIFGDVRLFLEDVDTEAVINRLYEFSNIIKQNSLPEPAADCEFCEYVTRMDTFR